MTKRTKFVISSILLSLGFIGIQFLDNKFRFYGIGGLTLFTVLLYTWSLFEGLGKNATLLTLILPSFFTLGVGLFWFLLPTSVYARLPVVVMYGFGMYSLSLTMNIFTVSAIRTIALSRAAKGVGFVLTLFTTFLLFDAVLSLRSSIFLTTGLTFVIAFPLFLQGLWTSKLDHILSSSALTQSLVFSYGLSIISVLLYFWPVTVVVGSLFLTVGMYVLLGLGQARQEGRLFVSTVREYLLVGIFVFLAMLTVTSWR